MNCACPLPGTPSMPSSGMLVTMIEYFQPVSDRTRRFAKWSAICSSVILSFRVSQACDLRCPVVDSVADGTLAA